jgi:hypothetical protein
MMARKTSRKLTGCAQKKGRRTQPKRIHRPFNFGLCPAEAYAADRFAAESLPLRPVSTS